MGGGGVRLVIGVREIICNLHGKQHIMLNHFNVETLFSLQSKTFPQSRLTCPDQVPPRLPLLQKLIY